MLGRGALDHFLKTFSAIDVGPHGSVTLRDEELALIARYPEPQGLGNLVGQKNASPELRRAVRANPEAGTYRTASSFDKVRRTYTYRKVAKRPLYVVVGHGTQDYLAGWWNEFAVVSALVALFIMATVFSSWMVYRAWTRRTAAVMALAQHEEALRESEEAARRTNALLQSIMESPQDMVIFALDTAYRYTIFTQAHWKAMKEMWGVEIEVGMNMPDAIPNAVDREKARANFDRALRGEHFIEVQELTEPRLRRLICEARYGPICAADGTISGLTVFVTDITERRRAEMEKSKLEAQLQQAQKMESVGRLAGGVAHDFNNMLQAILSHVDLTLDEIASDSPTRESLLEIRKCAQRSADLTRQLLAFARQQTIAPRILDLNETVEGLLKMLRRLIGEHIHLAWLPAAGLGLVKVDPSQIDQVLANLCVNARDAIAGVGNIAIQTANAVLDEASCADHPELAPGEYVCLTLSGWDTRC